MPRVLATAAAIGLAVIVAATLVDADPEQRLALQRVEQLVRDQLQAIGGDAVQLRSVRIWENSAGQMRVRLAVAASDESRQRLEQQLEPLMAAIAEALSLPVPEALTLELEPDQVLAPHHVAAPRGTAFYAALDRRGGGRSAAAGRVGGSHRDGQS